MTAAATIDKRLQTIQKDIHHLSSSIFGGRLSGTEGARRAADFLSSELQKSEYSPAGTKGFLTEVSVPASRIVGPARLKIAGNELKHRLDFAEWSPYSSGGKLSGELITVRDSDEVPPESLKGKIVLIPERPEGFDLKNTIESAVEHGIAALIVEFGEPKSGFHKTVFGSAGNKIPVIRLRRSISEKIADGQHAIVELDLPLVTESLQCHNVVGLLPGTDPKRTLLLTAHYDHLGDDPEGVRFPGTVDNASGVSVMLEAARMISRQKQRLPFNILIAFLTGEESGLWGARQLASKPPLPISAAINLDCLGFEQELYDLRVGHKEPGSWITELASEVITNHGINVRWIAGGDDSAAFIKKGIPTLGLGQKPTLPGSIKIHSADDNPSRLYSKPLKQGLDVILDIIRKLAERPDWE